MATVEEARRLRSLCAKYVLEGIEAFEGVSDETLAGTYNGIGPESFPQWLRSALDALHPSLAPVAFIHDAEWANSDGTRESFAASNARFKRNGCRVAKAEFGWWNPRRYIVMNHARRFGNICQAFGWNAWYAPYAAARKETA